ncbi:MAG: FIVAR domain-containing protein [Peptococcaceae bacterium]|nr:FIVAR domain-containing protein [Peptococcaceae bacterium]
MIIFYQIPDDSKAEKLREILAADGTSHMYVYKEAAGHTIGELFAGDTIAKAHPDASLPEDPGVIFNANDTSHEEATKFLEKLAENQIIFGYQVLADESMMDLPLGDVLVGHRDYQQFLGKLAFLQQMIDGCGALKQESYDPDKWSDLKIAVANANDFLDAVVNDTDSQFDEIDPKDVDGLIVKLQSAMQRLLN